MKQNDFFTGTQPKNNYNLLKTFSIAAVSLCSFANIYSQTNLALGKTAVASSIENNDHAPQFAIDGNGGTRWANNKDEVVGTDPALPISWIYVDLEANYNINHVVLKWEGAYATVYKVQISEDTEFSESETVSDITDGDGGTDELTISGSAATGRYVRILCLEKAPVWGYSLWEIEIYGNTPAPNLAIDDVTGQNAPSVTLYPNPTQDFVRVSFPEKLNNRVVTIHDLLGKTVLQTKLDDSAEESTININQLSKGTYIMNINSDGKNYSKKLIKN